MPSSTHRCRILLTAVAALLGGGLALAPAPAAAQAPGPAATVTPATGLLDLQMVEVQATGFPAGASLGTAMCDGSVPLTLADCDTRAPVFVVADGTGAATFQRHVVRFIDTNDGPLDCAFDACVLAVAALVGPVPDPEISVGMPVSFAQVPTTDELAIEVEPGSYLDADPWGRVTVPFTLSCAIDDRVKVEVTVWQARSDGLTEQAYAKLYLPCVAGTTIAATSDLVGYLSGVRGFEPGSARVVFGAYGTTVGTGRVELAQEITVASYADTLAALLARLADPEDTTAAEEFWATLLFRVTYNERFAQEFWRAVLAGT